jgi:5'-nucleotidase
MRILITNDDGVRAPGLLALKQALAAVGEVVVVAPERPRSACGHSVTLHKPLRLTSISLPDGGEAMACNGTPADCVGLAAHGYAGRRPDLVVSGINRGLNVGWDLTYSGTVAAAMEAAINDLPSFAISLDSHEPVDSAPAGQFARYLAERLLARGLPPHTFLNVNLPAGEVRGVAFTSQAHAAYEVKVEQRRDPRGQPYYWWAGGRSEREALPGTDAHALEHHLISITPIKLDLTDSGLLPDLPSWNLQWPA